jgi:transposase InsO family protein
VAHSKGKLSPYGRTLIAQRVVELGWSVKATAEAAGVSRTTVYNLIHRYREGGLDAMSDRSSAPLRRPRALPRREIERILRARRRLKVGPHHLSDHLGRARSTIYDVLRREGLSRMSDLDRPTGLRVRRVITADRPGERMHVDVKKVGRIPAGGGHRMLGRERGSANSRRSGKNRGGLGTDYLHSMLDAYSRVAYTEVHADEKGTTCAAFLVRAGQFFAELGVDIEEVITDEAKNYTLSRAFADALLEIGARHKTTGPYRPWINGKVERFHRTLNNEWTYFRLYTSNAARLGALPRYLERYNHRRPHTSLGGLTPMQVLVNYVSGKNS